MTHFAEAQKHERRRTTRVSAAVIVLLRSSKAPRVLQVAEPTEQGGLPVRFIDRNRDVIRLPEDVVVQDEDGNPILPPRAYWVSADTIDPFHLLIDREDP